MVEQALQLDLLFTALSDSTRRSILSKIATVEMSISEIAEHYHLTVAAISKHIMVLERAGLIVKRRRGKEQIVIIVPKQFGVANKYIQRYANLQSQRYNKLEELLKED